MEEDALKFDFEQSLDKPSAAPPLNPGAKNAAYPAGNVAAAAAAAAAAAGPIGQSAASFQKNYKRTVCTYWLRGLCMKGESCGFLHEYDLAKMPVCRQLIKFGVCKEVDCPYKHSMDDIKDCNMYKLGFCVYGPACRFKHTRLSGPPPLPGTVEAAKPLEVRRPPRDDGFTASGASGDGFSGDGFSGDGFGSGGFGHQRPLMRPPFQQYRQQQQRPPLMLMGMGLGGGGMRPPPPRPPPGNPPPAAPPPGNPPAPAAAQQPQQQPPGQQASAPQQGLDQQQQQRMQEQGMGMMAQGMMTHPGMMMHPGMHMGMQQHQQQPLFMGGMMQPGFPQPFAQGYQNGGY